MTFSRTAFAALSYTWTRCEVQALPAAGAEALARVVADDIIRHRTQGAPQVHASWVTALNGTALDPRTREILATYLEPGFGRPTSPSSDTLTQATVAEHLWHIAMNDPHGQRALLLVTKPKFHPTAPGGDGLIVFRDQQLFFELWEIKKYHGNSPSSAVREGCAQLTANAARYLAQYSDIGQERSDPGEKAFFAQLVRMWLDGDPAARAGICVASSVASPRCFQALSRHFPALTGNLPRTGLLFVVGQLPTFALRVRGLLWTGQ
jgi:hypothetical protein